MLTFIRQVDTGPLNPYYIPGRGFVVPEPKYLTKVWKSPEEVTSIFLPKTFDVVEEVEPENFKALYNLLRRYTKDPNACMLQHSMPPEFPRKNTKRNKEIFSIIPKSKYIIFDIDSLPRPDHIDPLDIKAQVDYAIGLLSEKFPRWFDSDMRYIAKGSSSAGIKTSCIRIHLYLQNSNPINTKQIRTIINEVNARFEEDMGIELFDTTLCDRAHILYTADPIFKSGMADPFEGKNRLVWEKDGIPASIPPNTEEKEAGVAIKLTDEDLKNLENYHGSYVIPPRVIRILEEIREEPENVYSSKAHRLMFAALEEGVCFDALETAFSVAMQNHPKILSGERTVQHYLNNSKSFALQAIKAKAIRTMPSTINIQTTPKEELSPKDRDATQSTLEVETLYPDGAGTADGYLHIPNLPPTDRLTFWKASLGTGKTTSVERLVNGDPIMGIKPKLYGRMLAITNTVSLVDGNAAKLGAPTNKAYLDREQRDAFEANPNGRMSTTIHSLHRFKEMADKGAIDFVFIDECDAVMDTLINGPANIMRERNKCIDALASVLTNSKYKVLADGDISEETIFSYFAISPQPISSVDYKVQRLSGSTAYEVKSEETLWINGVHCALDEGRKVLVMTDLGPEKINERVRALELLHPGMVIKGVHSDSTKDQDIRDILESTNTALDQYKVDCLICSPSVVSGVDFHYFDTVSLITNTKIATPNLRFQALRRCRKPNKEFWIYTDPDCSNFSTGYVKSEWKSDHLEEHIKEKLAIRKNKEYGNYRSNLRFMLMDQGCEVIVDSEVIQGETLSSVVEDMYDVKVKDVERMSHIDAIMASTEDYTPLRYNTAWETKNLIVHYYGLEKPEYVLREDVEFYLEQDIHKRMGALADVVRGGLWSTIRYNVGNLENFARFLKTHAKEWYVSTGENAFTGYGKKMNLRNSNYQARRIGLRLAEAEKNLEPNWDEVTTWIRKYYEYTEDQIPREFLTPVEIKARNESESDLSLKEESTEMSTGSVSKAWSSVLGFN